MILLVPPFAGMERPSLAAHVLQACARAEGFEVRVLYANLWLAAAIGAEDYVEISEGTRVPWGTLAGERLFSQSAYGHSGFADRTDVPALGEDLTSNLRDIEAALPAWCDSAADAIAELRPRLVGATTTFEQTNASIALLRRVKCRHPEVKTLVGGANCEAEMAEGIASLDPEATAIDYIFSGESEGVFPDFLRRFVAGAPLPDRIVRGAPCRRLDSIPTPDFSEYFEQQGQFFSLSPQERLSAPVLPYETSRGCWWGQKHHCTFCGLNGEGMVFRQKSAERAISELRLLAKRHPGAIVSMADNIMPHEYFKTLIPRLAEASLPLKVFYEQKANLSLAQLVALKRAGVLSIQPGIESLSSDLLRLMKKGVSARQNLALLRYARAAGVHVIWNMLCGFPGDDASAYDDTLALTRMIHHLQPPATVGDLTIDRFSPYFDHPGDYEVTAVRPLPAYSAALPAWAARDKVAYHFAADFPCGLHQRPELIATLQDAVREWQASWDGQSGEAPTLRVGRVESHFGHRWLLRDTRGLPGTDRHLELEPWQVRAALTQIRFEPGDEHVEWALERKLGAIVDERYVPFATAEPDLLAGVEQ